MSLRAILVEGDADVFFWSGLLERRLRCRPDKGSKSTEGDRRHFFRTPTGAHVTVLACGSSQKVAGMLQRFLRGPTVGDVYDTIALCIDGDHQDSGPPVNALRSLEGAAAALGATPEALGWRIGPCLVLPAIWWCNDPPAPHLPHKQELERLVCAAIHEVHPERALGVATWLGAPPQPPANSGERHALSHLAKWGPDGLGYGGWLSQLWQDESVAAALQRRLEATGVWAVATHLVR